MFLIRLLLQAFRRLEMMRSVYARHGIVLPAGAVIKDITAIRIGKGFQLGPRCELYCQDPENGSRMTIGDHVALNSNVMLNADCGGEILIGNDVRIGPNVVIRASNHRFSDPDSPIRTQGHEAGKIVIEDDVWIGAQVVVLPHVTIGKGSVIGAGAVVTENIPPYSLAVGVPARVLKKREKAGSQLLSEQTSHP